MKGLIAAMLLASPLLFLCENAANQPLSIGENLRRANVFLPALTPDKSQLVITDSVIVDEEDGGSGILVFYDDKRTKLKVDYLELYDVAGDLLLVSWIDSFGVCQIAIDRGLLDEERQGIVGVLVLITGGTSL
jgi:hypothetical protein